MPQYTFTSTESFISEVKIMADREMRSFSEMIDILLRQAVKEKIRKRNGKKLHIQDNPTDKC